MAWPIAKLEDDTARNTDDQDVSIILDQVTRQTRKKERKKERDMLTF